MNNMERTRKERLDWCRERAIQEMDFYKDPSKGIISMMSDLRKHPETNKEARLCGIMLMTKPKMSRQEVINFLDGFN